MILSFIGITVVSVLLSLFFLMVAQHWKKPVLLRPLFATLWFAAYIVLSGVPNLSIIRAQEWLLFAAFLSPFFPSSHRFSLFKWLFTGMGISLLFQKILFPIGNEISAITSAVLPLGNAGLCIATMFLCHKQKTVNSNLWGMSSLIAAAIIAYTGSIVYALQMISLALSLLVISFFTRRFPLDIQPLSIPFSFLYSAQISLAYHFSFLPWHSALLLLGAPTILLYRNNTFRNILFFMMLCGASLGAGWEQDFQ